VTFVGKILVLVITFLSIVFMSLAIVVYSSKTNWREEYRKAQAEQQKLKGELDDLKKQYDSLQQQYTDAVKKYSDELNDAREQVKAQQQATQELVRNYQDLRKSLDQAILQSKLAVSEIETRRKDVERLRGQLLSLLEEKDRITRRAFEAEQKLIEVTGELEIAQARNKELQERVARLTSILAEHGLPTDPERYVALQMPPRVEGLILKVDPQGRHVEISLGTDDGLLPGHRLHVYREREGKYLGQIEVIEADADRAVARVVPELRTGRIEEGDHVATYLTTSASR
jgi:multidrug efflux pump subunit AcrA (membrane-fusion protein)